MPANLIELAAARPAELATSPIYRDRNRLFDNPTAIDLRMTGPVDDLPSVF